MTQAESLSTNSETLEFQSESRRLLQLVVNSMYSNKEIFLRELLSNASDAADKLRFEALGKPELFEDDPELRVIVDFDTEAGTIHIKDNGIGMSRQEVIDNLGTIARSGTSLFLASLTGDKQKDTQLIGQFGIGFYSAFLVADEVEVMTRKAGSPTGEGVHWRSRGEDSYEIAVYDLEQRGTEVILHLKQDDKDFADGYRLRHVIRKYMDHLAIPVHMPIASEKQESGDDQRENDSKDQPELEIINASKALWVTAPRDLEDEQYKEFYKRLTHDFMDPLAWSHNHVEGSIEYINLLYIPGQAPFDLHTRERPKGLHLYVQRVFILDDAQQFLPLYLRFVRGIVDCNDLPLNISRELLQEDRRIAKMRSMLTKRVLDMLAGIARDDAGDYARFWEQFGSVLKEGMVEDVGRRETLFELLRFASTWKDSNGQDVSLSEYVARMPEGQDRIYYVLADSPEAARKNPSLEILEARGWEALLCCDRIDAWVMPRLDEYKDKKFQDAMRADAVETEDFDDAQVSSTGEVLVKKVAQVLGEDVREVRVSKRLKDSPSCLVLDGQDMNAQMRQLLQAAGQNLPKEKPVLELNTTHPLVKRLEDLAGENFADLARILLAQAYLAQGSLPRDPAGYTRQINQMLVDLLNVTNQ